MRNTLLIIMLTVCSVQYSIAQTYTIKGSIIDTLNMLPLQQASVVLISTVDSGIENFTRTKYDGSFQLQVANPGNYILHITFPSFADYTDKISIQKDITDLGKVPMVSKEHLLKEFVLTQQISAIKIKGDTTEYMADSFKVKPNATVEDLLKKLPGIQVDKNGQITAQGETVQKILVDGEEFFADDPKVVTQGFQASIVNKVQVFDKKSDQAAFTGIDDGQKTKTINLELKEDKKKGYFGKIDAGGGTDGYFQNQDMISAFKEKRQLSAFGIASNTDRVGLGWGDNDKFGGGDKNLVIDDDGFATTTRDQDELGGWGGKYNGEGLPKIWTGGIHYANIWDSGKNNLDANYRYAMQDVELDGSNTTQYILHDDTSNVSNERKNQFSKVERHAADGRYEWKIDSNTSVKLSVDAGYKNTQILSQYHTITSLLIDTLNTRIDSNYRSINSTAYTSFVNMGLLLQKKFAKKGRTLSVDIKENYKDSKSDGQLISNTIYNNPIPFDSSINQRKVNSNSTLAFAAKATYTEPLSKIFFMELNYGATVNNNTSENSSYDKVLGSTNDYDSLDRYYSSNYKYNILTNKGGLNFKFIYKKINFSFGSNVADASYLQTDLLNGDTTHHYNYLSLFPNASFYYKIRQQTSIKLTYTGSTKQPSITQIQPLRQDIDPLNLTIGNPNLKQEFTNTIQLNIRDFELIHNRSLFVYAWFNTINNAISTNQTTLNGINTTQYINVNGNYSGNCFVYYGAKIKKLDMNYGLQLSASTNHVNNIINGLGNTSNNNSYTFNPSLGYDKENKYDISWQPSVIYNDNTSTINTYATNYWEFDNNLSGSIELPKKLEIGSEVNAILRQNTVAFTGNNNVVKWDIYLEKKFLKNNQLELRATVNDILNQNIGYARTADGAIITQNSYNTIRRYGMLNLIWNFTHTPKSTTPPGEGTIMVQ